MSLSGVQLAYLTCRSGLARSGAVRSAFAPDGVQGDLPGSAGGFYMWTPKAEPTTVYDCGEPEEEPEPEVGSIQGVIGNGTFGEGEGATVISGSGGWVVLCRSDGSGQEGVDVQAVLGSSYVVNDVPAGSYTVILYSENDEAYVMIPDVVVVGGQSTDDISATLDTLGAHPSCPLA